MTLTHAIFRRILVITASCLVLALALAAWRVQVDTGREMRGAQALAPLLEHLVRLQHGGPLDATQEYEALRRLARSEHLRHVRLLVSEPQITPSLAFASLAASGGGNVVARWPLELPAGYVAVAVHEETGDESHEAWENFFTLLVVLSLLCAAIMLGVRHVLRASLQPLTQVEAAMQAVQGGDLGQRLAPFAAPELDRLRRSFNHLAATLADNERTRRELAQRVTDVAEAERARIARDLHDELGQQVAAMQLNLAWLQRTASDAAQRAAVDELLASCQSLRAGLRSTIAQLRPDAGRDTDEGVVPAEDLTRWIANLLAGWQHAKGASGEPAQYRFQHDLGTAALPEAVALGLFRMTQEALTNAARHAQASRVMVTLTRVADTLDWSVVDDGVGINSIDDAMQRGNGLLGLRERAWALGANIEIGGKQGTRLAARIRLSAASNGAPA